MLMPSIFNDNLFDDFFDFPFYDDKADRKIQRKLYGHHAGNLMKTDIKRKKMDTNWRSIFRDSRKMKLQQN